MNICNSSICSLLLLSLLIICSALCSSSDIATGMQTSDRSSRRPRRRVANLDSSASGAVEYMKKIRERYSDSEGRPTFEHEDDPTSIWCIMDRDMVNEAYRPKPSAPAKCTVQNRFIFNWNTLTKEETELRLPVQKAIIRAYLKPIRRLLRASPTPVDISTEVQLLGESEKFAAGNEQVEVTMSSSWLELEVTKGVSKLWPPTTANHDLEFTINLSVDCKDIKKVPAIFIDPTEIELSSTRRRQRYGSFQPLFLVLFNDAEIKEIVHNETESIEGIAESNDEFSQTQSENVGNRERRRASPCRPVDYAIVFHELHLDYIYIPYMYNAGQCSGSCSHDTLTGNHHLGTNHANIMAGAYAVYHDGRQNSFTQAPKQPCCVPTRYSSRTLVVNIGGALEYKVYPGMAVEECGCR